MKNMKDKNEIDVHELERMVFLVERLKTLIKRTLK